MGKFSPVPVSVRSIVWVRVAVGLIFATQGLLKYIDPNMGVNRFARIGFPLPLRRGGAPPPTAGAVLDGVNVASLALMAVVSWQLGRATIIDPLTAALAAASGVAIFRSHVNSMWLVAGGGLVGWLWRVAFGV
jgi:hypothetical protein